MSIVSRVSNVRPRILVGLLGLALAACAPKPAPDVTPASEPVVEPLAVQTPPPDLTEFYERLDGTARLYEDGTQLVVAGEEVLGERQLVTATNRLVQLAAECAATEGCELDRVLQTFQSLLQRQGIEIKKQASLIESLETSIEQAEREQQREPGTSAFSASMPELDRTVTLLRGTELQEIINLNGPVQAALDDWLTWMRPLLLDSWENYQYLRDRIAPVYEDAGLPEALLFAMIATETGGKVHSFSRAGAAGPLQFMRHTGRRYGLSVENGFDMRLDPEAATRANVAYLNDQFETLNGNLEKALGAYNGGENRMAALHRRFKDASFWDSRVYYRLPIETREYVPRILAAAWLFMHPEQYNLEFPQVDRASVALTLERDASIGELSVCLGQAENPRGWFRTLRNLNPRLDPGDRVKAGTSLTVPAAIPELYAQSCLEGDLLERAQAMHEANYPEKPEMVVYTVQRGDTLGRIASRHRCVSTRQLAELNRIRAPRYMIRVGQQLKIPRCA